MKKYFKFFAFLFTVLLVVACNSNDDGSSGNSSSDFSQNFGNQVFRDFIGQVVDQNNLPIQGVSVKIGTSTVQTDVNGIFLINGAAVYEQFAYISTVKSGYVNGSRALIPTSGKNNVKIMMIADTPVETIQSGVASEVVLPNGTKVNFDGAFQDENGGAYSGSVQVSMFHLEASNENLSQLMPGMLYAEDKDGNEKVLETFGMMNVELKGTSGQKLQIANGHTAQITMAIDNTQLAAAPSSIPLWHFDEVNGYWKEEGSAQKVGNNYVGTVSHFSWWNCDYPYEMVNLTINLVDTNGNPVPSASIGIALQQDGNYVDNRTNHLGVASGLVPRNSLLYLRINPSNDCGTVESSSVIGPFTSDTVTTLTIDLEENLTTISGNLLNCDNQGVNEGYVMLYNSSNISYIPLVNGSFSFNTTYCNSSFSLRGYDMQANMVSQLHTGTFTSPLTNIGNLTVCTTNFCDFNLEGSFSLVVTRSEDGAVYTFPNEIIHRVGQNSYKTSTTGSYSISTIPVNDAGFFFNINSCQNVTVPSQNLASVYSNLVQGIPSNNSIDGLIINENSFQINYEIVFASGVKTFTGVYTRN